jgi:hypothetical protein
MTLANARFYRRACGKYPALNDVRDVTHAAGAVRPVAQGLAEVAADLERRNRNVADVPISRERESL